MFGAWWGWLWVPPPVLDLLLNFYGGCHSIPMQVATSRSPAWQPFVGRFEKRVTVRFLSENTLKIMLILYILPLPL
jgi:hypothetical protein